MPDDSSGLTKQDLLDMLQPHMGALPSIVEQQHTSTAQQLPTDLVQLSKAQVKALHPAVLQQLSSQQLESFTPPQLPTLTVAQLKAIITALHLAASR